MKVWTSPSAKNNVERKRREKKRSIGGKGRGDLAGKGKKEENSSRAEKRIMRLHLPGPTVKEKNVGK